MVWIGNIIKFHNCLLDGDCLLVFYKSGRVSTIYKNDKLEKFNGDLKVMRKIGKGTIARKIAICIDPNEVESICISEEKL